MGRLRLGCPIWLDGPPVPEPAAPPLETHLSADVVIVGGGLTGAVIAHECVSRGLSTVVLESGRLARGSTSANTGLLVYEPDELLTSLSARYGVAAALRVWHRSQAAATAFIGALRSLRIACGLTPQHSIYVSTTAASSQRLRAEHDLRTEHGVAERWLNAGALQQRFAVRGLSAIDTGGHAQLDPFRACLGLLEAAAEAGARLHGGSRVTRIDVTARGVRVHTARGSVRARRVVIATGYATREFRPLAGGFALTHTYVLCTPPLSPAQRAKVGVPDVLVWSAERPYYYLRWGPDDRLIVGGADRPLVPESQRAAAFVRGRRRLAREVRALVPGLRGIPFERAWEGLFAVTPDGLPYIGPHPRYPHHLFALGYGGNGMVYAWLAAQMLTGCLMGTPDPDLRLFSFDRLGRRAAT
jgi:glycine/D-amino acid oxidase-like deaminating enzyme